MCPLKEAALEAPNALALDLLTFQELDRLADRLAQNLTSANIRRGDIVAFRLASSSQTIALFFAAWRIGASICPLSLRLPESQIESHLNRLQARIYIDSFPIKSKLREGMAIDKPSALLFTSGTTSLPKIAILPLAHLLNNAKSAIGPLNLKRGDSWLLNLPLYHVGGIGIFLRTTLALARLTLDPQDPTITHSSCVPAQLYRKTPLYKHLKCLLLGGAPLVSYPKKIPCYLTYGLTEMGSIVCARLRPPSSNNYFDLGPPLHGREIRLLADGEILLKGHCLFEGYWEEGKILKPFLKDGWFATRDLGRITNTNGLVILGRKDRQFISGGENIQPEEIERALYALPEVVEAAVVPVDDPEFGQRPIALLKASISDVNYFRSVLLETLPKFKIPTRFIFVEELPKTGFKINLRSCSMQKFD